MTETDWRTSYLRLHPKAALKDLEMPFVYQAAHDELYEIDDTAMAFLRRCDGTTTGGSLTSEADFVEYAIEEEILEALPGPDPVAIPAALKVVPSLRYLELHLTHRCNLACAHCYLEPDGAGDMPLADAVAVTREFAALGGLRLLISGGEPLLHKELTAFLDQTARERLRRVLFTNGTLVGPETVGRLDVDEIQFSLDGWETGHDRLRGNGAFQRLLSGVEAARAAGIPISFSTMIHRYNLDQFGKMAEFVQATGAIEWGIDVLAEAGSLVRHPELRVPFDEAVPLMEYGFGGGYHGASEGYACGRHLMTVMPDGRAVKCGFYMDRPLGNVRDGLAACWGKMDHIPLSALECRDCAVLDECRGGCRFRAPHPMAPDPAMCRLYGIDPPPG